MRIRILNSYFYTKIQYLYLAFWFFIELWIRIYYIPVRTSIFNKIMILIPSVALDKTN